MSNAESICCLRAKANIHKLTKQTEEHPSYIEVKKENNQRLMPGDYPYGTYIEEDLVYTEEELVTYADDPYYNIDGLSKREFLNKFNSPHYANSEAIRKLINRAKHLTQVTGVTWAVDHIWPICGKYGCGLNHELNLRVVTQDVNQRKINKWPWDMVHPVYSSKWPWVRLDNLLEILDTID